MKYMIRLVKYRNRFLKVAYIGVRGVPERDILSLCVMGWRLEKFGTSSAAAAVAPLSNLNIQNQVTFYTNLTYFVHISSTNRKF